MRAPDLRKKVKRETTNKAPRVAREEQVFARRFEQLLGSPLSLVLTDNRRTMLSWRINTRTVNLRLHRMFVQAPQPVLDALVDVIRGRRARSAKLIDAYFVANRTEERGPQRRQRLRTQGLWHDLGAILDDVNSRFLDGIFEGKISWGREVHRRSRRSIRLGSYSHSERLIRIHPALDQDFVPHFFVECVVYHEMLHQKAYCPTSRGRRRWHSAEFRALEARHPEHERAKRWEQENLSRLLKF